MQTAFITSLPVIRPSARVNLSQSTYLHRRDQPSTTTPQSPSNQPTPAKWTMAKGGKFGIFSPAVIVTKAVIGRKRLNKIRGKGIAIHSQFITGFCEFTGAGPKMRQKLIREAKENGDFLGFLS